MANFLDATAGAFMSKVFGYDGTLPKRYGEDFPAGFVVTEHDYTGKEVSAVALVGDMMPKVPFTTNGKQHLTKEYYPGNPEPSVQVLGARNEPVTIKGEFKCVRLPDQTLVGATGSGQARDVPAEMAKYFDELCRRGNLLKMVLGDWERWGYLISTTFNMKTRQFIEYELQFEIISDTKPENAKLIQDIQVMPNTANVALINAASVLSAQLAAMPPAMPQTLFDKINSAIGAVAAKINLVTNFIDASITTAEDATRLADRALGLVKNAQAAVSVFQRRIGVLSAYSVDPKKLFVHIPDSQKRLQNQKYLNETALSLAKRAKANGELETKSAAEILSEMRAMFAKLALTVPKARHLVADGDTLQKISVRYYQTADNAMTIYTHNKLTSTDLVTGTVLEIPKV